MMNGIAIFLLPPFKKSGLGHFYRSLVLQLENQPKDSLKVFFPFKNKKLVEIQNEIHPCAHIIGSKKFINFVSDEKKNYPYPRYFYVINIQVYSLLSKIAI